MTKTQPAEPGIPWHSGEVALQTRMGVAERMATIGRRVIHEFMPDQHRDFYEQLPFVALGTVDADGNAWATLIAGEPGFMSSPDRRSLDIRHPRNNVDPADAGLDDGAAVGLLGIELHTRRRNRMNGRVKRMDSSTFTITVEQSFGNCPQYIQLRNWHFKPAEDDEVESAPLRSDQLSHATRLIITQADTFFVSSYIEGDSGDMQVDVSHRGGKPGFIRIDDKGVLTIPDFAGNLHFNTLGNIQLNPRVGLIFIDFESGDMLHLSGDAEIVFDSPEIEAFQGAERLWRFTPRIVILRAAAMPLRWTFFSWSPNSLMTGDWDEVAKRIKAPN